LKTIRIISDADQSIGRSLPPDEISVALSIVIPIYGGARTIGPLVASLSRLCVEGGLEIILVNDGSPDDSDDECQKLLANAVVPIVYIQHSRNFGEHNAVMTGLRYARGSYIVTMDDDGQNPPEEVVRLYDHAKQGDWDVVYTRYKRKEHDLWRNIGSRFSNRIADWLMDKPPGLYLSSFRCLSNLVAGAVGEYRGPYPYIDGLVIQLTNRIDSIEVIHVPRSDGRSNYTLRKAFELWLNLATSFSVAPLRFATVIGMLMTFLGVIGTLYTIVEALIQPDLPIGWASTMTVILIVAGAQSMILGVVGEYVGRILLTNSGKPQSAVRKIQLSAKMDKAGGRILPTRNEAAPSSLSIYSER
jgi:glycosyltransferase involved in cell wall biosynthesis